MAWRDTRLRSIYGTDCGFDYPGSLTHASVGGLRLIANSADIGNARLHFFGAGLDLM